MRKAAVVTAAALLTTSVLTAGEAPKRIEFRTIQPLTTPCSISAILFHLSDGSKREERFDPPLAISAGKEVKPPALTRAVSALARGCWVETRQFDPAASKIVVGAWPLATLAFSHERIKPEPSAVKAAFVDVSAGESDTLQELGCSREGPTARCDLPAGRAMHVRVEWDGYAPIYAKNVSATEGGFVDLGPSNLVPAYKVIGRVIARDGTPIAGANVRLLPAAAGEMTRSERRLRTAAAVSDAKGNYTISGVATGAYRLVSEAAGHAEAVLDPVRIADRNVHPAPLVHSARARLEIVLTPPVAPDARPWRLQIARRGTRQFERHVVVDTSLSINGSWKSEPLENAEYAVTISDAAGSEVATREIVMDGRDELMLITIAGIPVHGRLLSGDEGVAAELTFSYQSGQTVRATAGADGAFSAFFPKAESCRADVVVPPNRIRVRLPDVEIRAEGQEALELRLPAGGIEGVVVDWKGKAAVAGVTAYRNGERRSAASGPSASDGSFAMRYIPEGTYIVEAQNRGGFAEPVEIDVSSEKPAKVRLVLQPRPALNGVVTGPSGRPLSGAVIRVFDPASTRYEDTVADAEGRFAMNVWTAGPIDVIVLAPPAPVIARRLSPPQWQDQLVAIAIPSASATLRLAIARMPPWPILTSSDGAARSLGLYLMPRFGSPKVIQELVDGAIQFVLEPGSYTACLGEDCRPFVLHTGSVATLDFIAAREKP